jgi:hypothetical protein
VRNLCSKKSFDSNKERRKERRDEEKKEDGKKDFSTKHD